MNFLNLFSSCAIINGFKNAIIFDVERGIYCQIPNEIGEFIKQNIGFHFSLQGYDLETVTLLTDYLKFLSDTKFIFFTPTVQTNVTLEKEEYFSSFELEDLIIDSDSFSNLKKCFKKIVSSPEYLQIRFFFIPTINELNYIIEKTIEKQFLSIELVLPRSIKIDYSKYLNLYDEYKIISRLVVYNCKENTKINDKEIYFITSKIKTKKHCGVISENSLYPNIRTYLSSKMCNSCLNKKISIDVNGDIRNCPSMPESFGNIKDTTLEEAIDKPGFKKYWNLTKDDIEICKDCEFRYICTDCRAYTERTNVNEKGLDVSKPLKCGYNPYTGEWEEWSTNPLKQKAIDFYGMRDLIQKK